MSNKAALERIENPVRAQAFNSRYALKEKRPDKVYESPAHREFVALGEKFIEKHLTAFQELAK